MKTTLRSEDKVDELAKQANISRNQWINKAIESVILALSFGDEKEIENYKALTGSVGSLTSSSGEQIFTLPQGCPGSPHLEVYENCKSNFESLG